MKIIIVLLSVALLFGCNLEQSVATPDHGNIVPFADVVSANTDYIDTWHIGPDTHFVMRSFDSRVIINGKDYIDFTTIASPSYSMEYVVIVSIGDVPVGTEITILYQPSKFHKMVVN